MAIMVTMCLGNVSLDASKMSLCKLVRSLWEVRLYFGLNLCRNLNGKLFQKIVLFTVSLWLSDVFLIECNTRLVGCCFVCTFRIEMWHPLWTAELNRVQDGFRKCLLSVRLALIIFARLFYYSAYFYYYSWVSLHFLVLFMGLTVLFQLTFTFIYSTFSKKFSVSVK